MNKKAEISPAVKAIVALVLIVCFAVVVYFFFGDTITREIRAANYKIFSSQGIFLKAPIFKDIFKSPDVVAAISSNPPYYEYLCDNEAISFGAQNSRLPEDAVLGSENAQCRWDFDADYDSDGKDNKEESKAKDDSDSTDCYSAMPIKRDGTFNSGWFSKSSTKILLELKTYAGESTAEAILERASCYGINELSSKKLGEGETTIKLKFSRGSLPYIYKAVGGRIKIKPDSGAIITKMKIDVGGDGIIEWKSENIAGEFWVYTGFTEAINTWLDKNCKVQYCNVPFVFYLEGSGAEITDIKVPYRQKISL